MKSLHQPEPVGHHVGRDGHTAPREVDATDAAASRIWQTVGAGDEIGSIAQPCVRVLHVSRDLRKVFLGHVAHERCQRWWDRVVGKELRRRSAGFGILAVVWLVCAHPLDPTAHSRSALLHEHCWRWVPEQVRPHCSHQPVVAKCWQAAEEVRTHAEMGVEQLKPFDKCFFDERCRVGVDAEVDGRFAHPST